MIAECRVSTSTQSCQWNPRGSHTRPVLKDIGLVRKRSRANCYHVGACPCLICQGICLTHAGVGATHWQIGKTLRAYLSGRDRSHPRLVVSQWQYRSGSAIFASQGSHCANTLKHRLQRSVPMHAASPLLCGYYGSIFNPVPIVEMCKLGKMQFRKTALAIRGND